jgi:hypothetical protein
VHQRERLLICLPDPTYRQACPGLPHHYLEHTPDTHTQQTLGPGSITCTGGQLLTRQAWLPSHSSNSSQSPAYRQTCCSGQPMHCCNQDAHCSTPELT